MAIKIYLEEVLKKKNMTSKELCRLIGITEANLLHPAQRQSQGCPLFYD